MLLGIIFFPFHRGFGIMLCSPSPKPLASGFGGSLLSTDFSFLACSAHWGHLLDIGFWRQCAVCTLLTE